MILCSSLLFTSEFVLLQLYVIEFRQFTDTTVSAANGHFPVVLCPYCAPVKGFPAWFLLARHFSTYLLGNCTLNTVNDRSFFALYEHQIVDSCCLVSCFVGIICGANDLLIGSICSKMRAHCYLPWLTRWSNVSSVDQTPTSRLQLPPFLSSLFSNHGGMV